MCSENKIFVGITECNKLAAILCLKDGRRFKIEDDGSYPTPNRTELNIIVMALRKFKPKAIVKVYCNSSYITNMFNTGLVNKWQNNGWLTQKKETVKNQDLIEDLLEITKQLNVTFYGPNIRRRILEELYD